MAATSDTDRDQSENATQIRSVEEVENATLVEIPPRNPIDYLSLWLGRVAMGLIAFLVLVMTFEVFMRYVVNSPTIWANGTSVWVCAFIFLLSGLYAMQQRAHIRIFIIYDLFPRNLQRACDVFSTALIVIFAVALVWGAYSNALRVGTTLQGIGEVWLFTEPVTVAVLGMLGFSTADDRVYIDPPLPGTLKPAILIVTVVLALQSVVNLIADWSKEKETHSPIDE